MVFTTFPSLPLILENVFECKLELYLAMHSPSGGSVVFFQHRTKILVNVTCGR